MGLQSDDAVRDVDARLLERLRPDDVGLLVEPGLQLDERHDLFAGLGGVQECSDDRAPLSGRPVEGDLDREHLRVPRGLLDEGLHRGRERVVRVVDEHIALTEHPEQIGLLTLWCSELGGGHGREGRELQFGTVEVGQLHQSAQAERAGQHVHIAHGHLELAYEQLLDLLGHLRLHLETDGTPEPPPVELRLDGEEQIVRLFLLDLEVGVAGDAEDVMGEHLDPGEQPLESRRDQGLQRHEAVAADGPRELDEAREDRRDLHAGEALVAVRVAEQYGKIEREVGDVGEGMRGIDGQRREDGEDEVLEDLIEVQALGL